MKKKILIWTLPVLALIGGTAAGSLLAPDAPPAQVKENADGADTDAKPGKAVASDGPADWFSFPNQFFVPIVRRGTIDKMMVLTLTIETTKTAKPEIEAQEHRLRDALLRSLIIHANTGGFAGNYTAEAKLQQLRDSLFAAATKVAGPEIRAVLIEDLAQADA